MGFNNDIKMIRHKCLMIQIEFAEVLGVSFATVNRWDSGRRKPNFKTMKLINKFCEARGIDLDVNKQLMKEEKNDI